jgi:hypothetical protein
MYLILAILLSGLELLYEGFKYQGKTRLSEYLELTFLMLVTVLSFTWLSGIDPPDAWALSNPYDILKVFIGYGLVRFGYFDIVMNMIRRREWYYTGNKSWDQFILWLQRGIGTNFFGFIRLCSLIAGTLILLYVNNEKYRVLW